MEGCCSVSVVHTWCDGNATGGVKSACPSHSWACNHVRSRGGVICESQFLAIVLQETLINWNEPSCEHILEIEILGRITTRIIYPWDGETLTPELCITGSVQVEIG